METQSFLNGEIIDFSHLKCRARHGWTEAYCDCGAWIRITPNYQGNKSVTRSVPHNPPCEAFIAFLKAYSESVAPISFDGVPENNDAPVSDAAV